MVATAGDVNGDGYGDLIVGAPWSRRAVPTREGRTSAGRGTVRPGLSSGRLARGGDRRCAFGLSVASAGDVNGDGYGDVIVGALHRQRPDRRGARPSSSTARPRACHEPGLRAEADQAGAHLGNSVAAAGDVNRDGFSDVIVGARIRQRQSLRGAGLRLRRRLGMSSAVTGRRPPPPGRRRQPGRRPVRPLRGRRGRRQRRRLQRRDRRRPSTTTATRRGPVFVFLGSAGGLSPPARRTGARRGARPRPPRLLRRRRRRRQRRRLQRHHRRGLVYDAREADSGTAFVWHGSGTGVGSQTGTPVNADWRDEGSQAGAPYSARGGAPPATSTVTASPM